MLTFKEFLTERFKSEHEINIRQLASAARQKVLDRATDSQGKTGATLMHDLSKTEDRKGIRKNLKSNNLFRDFMIHSKRENKRPLHTVYNALNKAENKKETD